MNRSDLVATLKERLATRTSVTGISAATAEAAAGGSGGFREAAAVLVSFDMDTLKPAAGALVTDTREGLLSISEPLPGGSNRDWTLQTAERIAALHQIRTTSRIEAALDANPERTQIPAQTIFEQYMKPNPPQLESLSLVQLTALQRVADWLRLAGFPGIPDSSAIRNRTDWFKLLQPFEHLAADSFFRGRQSELARLRSYVGVVDPGIVESVRRGIVGLVSSKLPLLVYGPGGVGKSSLVARFILEHARAHEQDRFPFIYLDFDRPEITGSQPLTLLIEAVRQLGIEYQYERERCERIRQSWLGLFRSDQQSSSARILTPQQLTSAVVEFGSLIGTIVPPDSRVVIVLDTFEEVQYRSDEQVTAILSMVDQLRQIITNLYVIVVGRATIPAYSTEDLLLDGFDSESAIGYLSARGISNPTLAAQIAKLVGGNPMNLHLAADLAIREGIQSALELGINTREYFFLRLNDAQIQRQLYNRVLGHVHDPSVRKLAQPGLVLRRITADLIYKVLNKPCDLSLQSVDEAESLFRDLRREKSLVQIESDGALVHRPELRKQTLRLLCQDAPEKANEIHLKAVEYYSQRPAVAIERAEEIYHRLWVGEDLDTIGLRWIPGVEPYLQDAFDEFTGAAKAFLASPLHREVDIATRQLAALQDWENIVKRKAADLLAVGAFQDVLKMMGERGDRTVESELFTIEATALYRMGRFAESFRPLHRGIDQAIPAGARRQVVLLIFQAAQNAIMVPRSDVPDWLVPLLTELPEASLAPEDRVALNARKIALAARDFPLRADSTVDIDANLRTAFDKLNDNDLVRRPEIGWWAVTAFATKVSTTDVARLRRVITNAGLPQREPQLRELAARCTSLDVAVSQNRGEVPGALARELHIPPQSSLTLTWSQFLLSGSASSVRDGLVEILSKYETSIRRDIILAFADLMRAGLEIALPDAKERSGRIVQPALKFSTRAIRGLTRALADSFTPDEFEAFLRLRLNLNLDSISNSTGTATERVNDVVKWAIERGVQSDLIEAARQSRPDNLALIAVASELGVSMLAPPMNELPKLIGDETVLPDVNEWLRNLGLIEPCLGIVESGDGLMLGTGFLIGPDLMLTPAHVLGTSEVVEPLRIRARFDQKSKGTGRSSSGRVFDVAEDSLVAISSPNELDMVVLRLRTSPGLQPIGTARAEASAALRGWIHLDSAIDLQGGEDIFCTYFDRNSSSSHLAMGKYTGGAGGQVRYQMQVPPGASGAPCFNRSFQLSGVITGTTGQDSFGTAASAINRYLAEHGLGGISAAVIA